VPTVTVPSEEDYRTAPGLSCNGSNPYDARLSPDCDGAQGVLIERGAMSPPGGRGASFR